MANMKFELSKAVLKATDAKLRNDNWQYIMEVTDLVREDPEDNGKEVMKYLERRLEQTDANVILRSLTLIIALAENCGSRLKQEISSKWFTNILYSIVDNKSIHIDLRKNVASTVEQLSKSFKDDPSLRAMNDIYRRILKNHRSLLKNQPNKPVKDKLNTDSKLKEEKDLEEAIKLSLQEYEQVNNNNNDDSNHNKNDNYSNSNYYVSSQQQSSNGMQPQSQSQSPYNSTNTNLKKVKAMYDLSSTEVDELSFKKGDTIIVLEQVYRDWWRGCLRGHIGIFPLNYVTPISESIIQEKEKDSSVENKIFNEKDKIDQLHQLLKNNSNNTEITQKNEVNELYSTVTPMRSQITRMIGKYAKEKDDLTSLRQVLSNAESTYNQLMNRAADAYKTTPQQQYQTQGAVPQLYQPQQPQQYLQQPQLSAPPSYGNAIMSNPVSNTQHHITPSGFGNQVNPQYIDDTAQQLQGRAQTQYQFQQSQMQQQAYSNMNGQSQTFTG